MFKIFEHLPSLIGSKMLFAKLKVPYKNKILLHIQCKAATLKKIKNWFSRLIVAKSIAECSMGSILQYFDLH